MGLSPIRPPGSLRTGGAESCQALRYPGDWRDSVLLGPQVPWGLARLSPFRPLGTMGTGPSRRTGTGGSLTRVPKAGTGTLTSALTTHSEQDSLVYMPWLQANGGLDSAQCAKGNVPPPGTFPFARFALSKPPFACSQGIQVHQARFRLHVLRCLHLRLLAARVYPRMCILHRRIS